ncbi:metal-dependent hydrolase [Halomarina rubra]|uniref:Metal-dependent hydrolase n=1 Tax=Halomarina rubra TaxID=2071873 RepID=A0ABD6ASM3_9EURY|nr:metal-dependent hydrolase [Halomarina rubra]
MVDVLGHLGMALIWLSPCWLFIDDQRTAVTVLAVGFWFGMLPDTDLVLSSIDALGVHHHGVVHTVLFVVLAAATVGPLLGLAMRRLFGDTKWLSSEAAARAVPLGVVVVFVTGLSHLFADTLSAPDKSTRLEVLWPLVEGPVVYVDVLYYKSFWATIALFVGGLAFNAAFWYLTHGRSGARARSDPTR